MLRRNLVFVSVLVITLILSGCQLFVKPTLDRIVVSRRETQTRRIS